MYVCEISKNEAKLQAPAYNVSLLGILIIARHSLSRKAIVPTARLKLHFTSPCFRLTRNHTLESVENTSVRIAASRKKVPNGLSRWHTKRRIGVHGRARPSFGMTPTF